MGYMGKFLKIDLSKEKSEEIQEDLINMKKLIGGKRVAMEFISDSNPLSDENTLVFITGPFTGDKEIPNGGRFAVGARGLNGEKSVSSVGGRFGISIKLNGYDGILIDGKAKTLSYILIEHSNVEILDASHLKGMGVLECTAKLSQNERTSIACVGPSGENLVPFSAILFDGHISAGKNGLGALMGNKNLKAIKMISKQEIKDPCTDCPLNCEKRVLGTHWKEAGRTFMQNCGITDPDEVKTLVNLCDDLGIDSIRAGEIVTSACNEKLSMDKLLECVRAIPKNKYSVDYRVKDKADPLKEMMDSFGFCAFSYGILKGDDYAKMISQKMQIDLSSEELIKKWSE